MDLSLQRHRGQHKARLFKAPAGSAADQQEGGKRTVAQGERAATQPAQAQSVHQAVHMVEDADQRFRVRHGSAWTVGTHDRQPRTGWLAALVLIHAQVIPHAVQDMLDPRTPAQRVFIFENDGGFVVGICHVNGLPDGVSTC